MRLLVLILACGVVAVGCGEDAPEPITGLPDADHTAEVERNPFAVTCGDLIRQPESPEAQKLVIRAEFALASRPELRKRAEAMTLNRAGRSVYWAMTELCKGREESFTPGKAAVAAVRRGKYLVQPRPQEWSDPYVD